MKWYDLLLTEFFYECFITVALLTSQVEIAMCCLNTIAQILQNEQQRHTVCPTAQRYKMQSLATQKSMLPDEISNFLFHSFTYIVSLYIEHQSFQIFTLWVIDVDGMISRLMQLVQDTYLSSCLGCSRKDCIAEMILRHHL